MSGIPDIGINVLEHPEDVHTFWAWLTKPRQWVAVDTETTGLDVYAPGFHVRMLQFGDIDSGWAIDFQRWRGLCDEALRWCRQHKVVAVFHNALYDANALAREGIKVDWSLIGDTFVLAAIDGYADESRALKDLCREKFGNWATTGQSVLHKAMQTNGWTWETIPWGFQPYPMYGVLDTVLTAKLWEGWWETRATWQYAHSLEIGTLRVVQGMMQRGVGVDGKYIVAEMDRLYAEEAEITARLLVQGVGSPSNNAEVGAALERAGVVLTAKTATGKTSVAKDVLGEIDHPIARDVLRVRRVHRDRTNYLGALLKAAGGDIGEHALIHPSINPIEARTGRMSVANPPMQQLPRENPLARNGIVPRAEGEVLVTADYGQIELRMWARLTRDEALANVLRTADATGEDFFVAVGRDVYQDPGFVKKDPRRSLIKNTCYGTIYGAGVEKMAETAGVPFEVMDPIAYALKERYPSFRTLGMDLIQQGADSGRPYWSVASPYHGRQIKVRRRDEARKLPNYLDQGSSAVILKQALLYADAAGIGDYLCLPVHDEILLSVPKEDAADAAAVLKECMDAAANNGTETFGVRITADPSEPGHRWGELAK